MLPDVERPGASLRRLGGQSQIAFVDAAVVAPIMGLGLFHALAPVTEDIRRYRLFPVGNPRDGANLDLVDVGVCLQTVTSVHFAHSLPIIGHRAVTNVAWSLPKSIGPRHCCPVAPPVPSLKAAVAHPPRNTAIAATATILIIGSAPIGSL
jgi:hypothetical protein